MIEAEVVEPQQRWEQPQVRLTHVRALGIFGTLLALLTMAAAVAVGFVAFFATSLLASALVYAVWPLVFSAEFTQWVFGAPHASFWKFFLVFLVAGTVSKVLKIRRK